MVRMQDEMLAPNGNGSRGVLSALLYLFFPTLFPPPPLPPCSPHRLFYFMHRLSLLLSSMFSFLTPRSLRFAI